MFGCFKPPDIGRPVPRRSSSGRSFTSRLVRQFSSSSYRRRPSESMSVEERYRASSFSSREQQQHEMSMNIERLSRSFSRHSIDDRRPMDDGHLRKDKQILDDPHPPPTTGGGGDNSPRITGGRSPTRNIDEEEEGYRKQCTNCAQTALQHIYKRLGVVYELVDIGESSAFKGPRSENCFYIHSNFEAKPQGSHPSQTILFFAELKVGFKLPRTVNHYCPLGLAGQVNTGLNGCLACDSTDPIHHPIDQNLFYVGTEQMSLLSG